VPRKVRDSNLETRTARARLRTAAKPYFRLIEPGLHLGYRKLTSGPGTWVVRRYAGDGKYAVKNLTTADGALVIADDHSDSDGVMILTFGQAQERAKEQRIGGAGPIPTVRLAIESYIAERDARETRRKGRSVRSDAHRLGRHIIGRDQRGKRKAIAATKLADLSLDALDENDLRKWRAGLRDMTSSSKQRIINDLKAALSGAYAANRSRLSPSLPATIKHGLKAVSGYDEESEPLARDNQILTDAQVSRLIRAAREIDNEQEWEGDLYRMTIALAATGARFSQLARMHVSDCQADKNRLMVPRSRKGKGKSGNVAVQVGRDVLTALLPATAGRAGSAFLFERWRHRQTAPNKWERSGRAAWQSASEYERPWEAIRERAKMPDVIPYALRHSSIVRGIRANLPIRLVAAMHDTSVVMIERHYAKYIVDGLEELAARAVVPLVPPEKRTGKIVPMRRA
jgi:integrase